MAVTCPQFQGGTGGVTASPGTCLGCGAGGHLLSIVPSWSRGGSAEQNHRVDPVGLEFSVGLRPPDGLGLGQRCLQCPQLAVMSMIFEFAQFPAPALLSCSALQPATSPAPLCLFLICKCFSIMQNIVLKALSFLQLLIDVCISGLFTPRLMKGFAN